MKTNEQFISGVYQKAKFIKKRQNITKAITSTAVAVVVVTGVTTYDQNKSYPMMIDDTMLTQRMSLEMSNIEELVEGSDMIAHCYVERIGKSYYNNDGNMMTDVTLSVKSSYKGNNTYRQLILSVGGGYDSDKDYLTPYQEHFAKDEHVLLFMVDDDNNDDDQLSLTPMRNSKATLYGITDDTYYFINGAGDILCADDLFTND